MIEVIDMTGLFKKEMLIYSLFDIRLDRPLKVVFLLYLILITPIPAYLTWWLLWGRINAVWVLALMFGPSIFVANLMSKPIYGGKSFMDWLKTMVNFILSPKHFYDHIGGSALETERIDSRFLMCRRNDYLRLLELKQEEANNA